MADVDADVVIVGAGVAGLTLAAELGRAGHTVLLIDKAAAPRDKVCGEGVMPLGLRTLEALGAGIGALPGADFAALDYRTRRQRHTLHFRPGVFGRGLRRTALIEHLERRALQQPTVTLVQDAVLAPEWEGERIVAVRSARASYQGRAIVAADGVNSVLTRRAGAAPQVFGYRMGVRRHYRLPEGKVLDRVHVGLFGRHDVYLTPVGNGEMLATTMTDRIGYGAAIGDYDTFLRSTPYGELFAGAEPVSEVLGWYHPLFRPASYTPGGAWLMGDASGGIDPCLGMGISMALVEARHATGLLIERLRQPERAGECDANYALWRRDLFHHYHDFGRLFRSLVTTPVGSAALVGVMRLWPAAANRIFSSIAEMRPWPVPLWRTPAEGTVWNGAPLGVARAGSDSP